MVIMSRKQTNETIAPIMKVNQAKHIIDKNSITINKMNILISEQIKLQNKLKANNSSNNTSILSPEYLALSQRIEHLRLRLDRRLHKLAKWADISAEERWKDLRNNSIPLSKPAVSNRPMVYNKQPMTATQTNALNNINANRAKLLLNQQQATQKAYQNMASIYSNIASGQLPLPIPRPPVIHSANITLPKVNSMNQSQIIKQ